MAAVEILAILAENIDYAKPPATTFVEKCREAFLREWDAYIDVLGPVPGHKEARRAVIVATFERLLAICRKCDAEDGPREEPS